MTETPPKSRPSNADIDVAIVGAGIGGVAAAAFLHRAGFKVDVYDQAPEFSEVGGTITIDKHSIGVLREWGIDDAVLENSVPCKGLELRKMGGEFLSYVKLPDLSDLGVEVPGRTGTQRIFGVQRSDLHSALLRFVPASSAHPAMRVRTVTDHDTHAEAEFEDGTVIRPRVLIGADGIRSTVRKLFSDVEARPTSAVICRSLAPVEALPADWPNDRLRRWEHPLDDGGSVNALFAPSRGAKQFGIDTSLYEGDQLLDIEADIVPLERLLSCYPDDTDPVVIAALKTNLIAIRAYRLFDLPEVEVWSGRSVTLLGDAAHAMRPLLGQGANQAIQDADELARCLGRVTEVGEALQKYEQVRAPFTAAIQRAAREFRPQYVEMMADAEKQSSA